jgi:RNA recognition motif-containing protein
MPRGFGFVTFSDPSVIDKVLEDDHVIDGRTVGHLIYIGRNREPQFAALQTSAI